MKRSAPVIGVDLGATRTRVAVVDGAGRPLARVQARTEGDRGVEAAIDRMADLLATVRRRLGRRSRPRALGVGFCGMVDHPRGVVLETTDTMPGWRGVPLAAELSRRTGLPCACDNDANAAALGEATYGAGRGRDPLVMLTLGTGVGGGIVIDGEILRGAGQMAAHLGHLLVRRGGRRCACGARGCLEAYASAWALQRRLGCDARAAFARAARGDTAARRAVAEAAEALGTAFALIANTLNPGVIVVGGGLSRSFGVLAPRALEVYRARALAGAHATSPVRRARRPTSAGVLGAAVLARAVL